tara:strand:- start:1438 stop:2400 length:963 start_codon:yes stop_codon:yes gene_type:complete
MFNGASYFNQYIGNWNVSNVTSMNFMFSGVENFNQDIGSWDTSNVIDMSSMFRYAISFNQNIGSWDTINLIDMGRMFDAAADFNQDIGNWDTSNVTDMNHVFHQANSFNQDIGNWDTTNVTDMFGMFREATNFNQDISNWNTSNVVTMQVMFYDSSFNQNIANWDVQNVYSMYNMFNFSEMSTQNYDNILIAWEQQSVQSNVQLGAVGITFCLSENARQNLIDNHGWTINDDGIDSNCTASITDQENLSNIQIYPNPVYDYLKIKGNGSEFVIKIFDISGRLIMQSKIIDFLDISDLNKGIYLAEFSYYQTSIVRKIIKN